MRYDFAVTQARTQGMVFIQAGGIPLDGGIPHGETGHKPSHCAPTSALKVVVVTSVTTVVSLTLLRAR